MRLHKPKEIEDCKTITDVAYYHRYKFLTEQDNFHATFKEHLSKFWTNNLTGFDIIAFDKWIGAGDEGLRDVVTRNYGKDAAALIERLI